MRMYCVCIIQALIYQSIWQRCAVRTTFKTKTFSREGEANKLKISKVWPLSFVRYCRPQVGWVKKKTLEARLQNSGFVLMTSSRICVKESSLAMKISRLHLMTCRLPWFNWKMSSVKWKHWRIQSITTSSLILSRQGGKLPKFPDNCVN